MIIVHVIKPLKKAISILNTRITPHVKNNAECCKIYVISVLKLNTRLNNLCILN